MSQHGSIELPVGSLRLRSCLHSLVCFLHGLPLDAHKKDCGLGGSSERITDDVAGMEKRMKQCFKKGMKPHFLVDCSVLSWPPNIFMVLGNGRKPSLWEAGKESLLLPEELKKKKLPISAKEGQKVALHPGSYTIKRSSTIGRRAETPLSIRHTGYA